MQHILVADDDDGLRAALGEFFARLGYQVLEAADGPSALSLLRARNPLFSILDFHMPGMTGLEVLRRLRQSGPSQSGYGQPGDAAARPAAAALTKLPCILVSAEASLQERDEAIAIGAFDFLEKPFDISMLLECVQAAVRTFGPLEFSNLDLSRLLAAPRNDGSELPAPLNLFPWPGKPGGSGR